MHIRSVIRLSMQIQLLLAIFMLLCALMAFCMEEIIAMKAFLITIGFIICFAAIAVVATRNEKTTIKAKDSYLLVTLTWILAAAFGALPLYFTKTLPDYAQCFFEIMSGYTTTGATALTSIEDKMRSILFWRNLTNWLGGMGIVVLFVAILPMLGVKGMGLVGAESAGPTKDKLLPRIQQTAFVFWAIYVGLSLAEILLLLIKVPLYDAVTIAFGTMSSAGFCTKDGSIGSYGSVYVNIITTIFMLLSGINFVLFFKLLRGKIKEVLEDSELRLYLSIILVISLLIAIDLFAEGIYRSFAKSLEHSVFQTISIITTTGFSTFDFETWPTFSKSLLLLLFFVGGSAGSTSGGIKVIRIYMVMRLAQNTIKKRLHPNAISPTVIGGTTMSDSTLLSVAGFIGAYIITGLISTVIFSMSGSDFETCFSTSFGLLGNIGVGFGDTGPTDNFSIFNGPLLYFGSFLMLVGRLEIFTVYALFTKSFWQK